MCGDTRDDAFACRRFATKSRFASVFLGLKSQAVSCRSFAAKTIVGKGKRLAVSYGLDVSAISRENTTKRWAFSWKQ